MNKNGTHEERFRLTSSFTPTGDQPQAIRRLTENLEAGMAEQVLVGVTGSGKTFTMANVIANTGRPALIISHNKTLAAQLFQEFRDFFPRDAVSYFVSYYDYYQPEAYIPQSDTYIEKETEINEEIDKLRLAATTNILTRRNVVVVASVSCIYNIGSPKEYGHFVLELKPGMKLTRESVTRRLITLQYERNDFGFHRGTFRVRGDTVDLLPAYDDQIVRIVISDGLLTHLESLDPLTGKKRFDIPGTVIYPAKHYMTNPANYADIFREIRHDLVERTAYFTKQRKFLEAQRIRERVDHDLEMIQELGYVNGIENYSRYFDGRKPGEPPYTLFDYFDEVTNGDRSWLLFVDESHMTVPQLRGMYNGDRSRKQTLIDYGFRLPAALDNRPMRFDEILRRAPQTVYVSATPGEWEIARANECASPQQSGVIEQLIRPTGLIDPKVSIRPTLGQIDDLIREIATRVRRHERTLVTTLTKRMAEDLSSFLEKRGIRVNYLHSDVETLVRTDILAQLRMGTYDVIVGINLLREGLDLPEVSLVAILDADKEGFLRSKISLIQTMGRAARHIAGEVILYTDRMTDAIHDAVAEVARRRNIQETYNRRHMVTPKSIEKPIRKPLVDVEEKPSDPRDSETFSDTDIEALTPMDRRRTVARLKRRMTEASRNLQFEDAAHLRDLIIKLSEIH